MDTQFFENRDRPVAGRPGSWPVRHEPAAFEWPGGNRVAVQVVVNYEEGSEKSFPMGDGRNDGYHELPYESRASGTCPSSRSTSTAPEPGSARLFRIFTPTTSR